MKKTYLLVFSLLLMLTFTACSKENNVKNANTNTENTSTVEDTKDEELTTKGILKSYDASEVDKDGNTQALFTDSEGSEFIAIIGKDTKVDDELEVGKEYIIHHLDMQTSSLPPILPQVSHIELLK